MRFYAVSILWTLLMALMFLSIDFPELHRESSTNAKFTFQYFFVFGWLNFLWLTSFKRQLTNNFLRRRASSYAITLSFSLLIVLELVNLWWHEGRLFQWYWNVAGAIGIYSGKWLFGLVYER